MACWINPNEHMPVDDIVVIGRYEGRIDTRGNGGVIDVYAHNGKWINLPDGVSINGWMYDPENLPRLTTTTKHDISRIDRLLFLLNAIWVKNPELRFNQLIYLVHDSYSAKRVNLGRVTMDDGGNVPVTGFDMFNLSDDKFIDHLEQVLHNGLSQMW
ncbi:hypothetical protein [Vibrio sp. Hal054]|uniref:hypothetical protein n=1 Tax=Vibrio sp. Hal054 TaxID=3035158 RepID=UPI00301D5E1F